MKTGMEFPLALMFLLLAGVLGYSAWTNAQVGIEAARVEAMAAGQELPVGWLSLSEMALTTIVKVVAGTLLTGVCGALAVKAWQFYQRQKQERAFRSPGLYPAAPRQPRLTAPSERDLMLWSLYNQMSQPQRPQLQRPPLRMAKDDDEEDFTF